MDCPLCGARVSESRPRYNVGLRVSDDLRAATAASDDTAEDTQVCEDCWSDLKGDLSSE